MPHFIPDDDDPYAIVSRLMDGLPSGSYLVIGHGGSDIEPAAATEMASQYNARLGRILRGRAQTLAGQLSVGI